MKIKITHKQLRLLKEEVSTDRDLLNVYNIMVNNNIVDPEHVNENSDNFEVYGLLGKQFDYFLDNFIKVTVDGQTIYLDFEYYEEDVDDAEKVSDFLEGSLYKLLNPSYEEDGWWIESNY